MASGSKPSIFLSHSGAQKPFTEQLYYELYHVNHRPFFDLDPDYSLPKCEEFPKLIEEACRECKMGVVVLSHEYIESFWPMWELEQLVFHNPSAQIYPLFYELSPGDLSSEENLLRWQGKWDKISLSHHHHDISMWSQALKKLNVLGGEVFQPKTSQHDYIQRIVTNIRKKLPPPPPNSLAGDIFIKGKERMAKIIVDRFKAAEESSKCQISANLLMGVHGVGGSGKTTLCKNMTDFYNASEEYAGKSWCLELPSDGDEKKIVEELRKALHHFTQVRADDNIDNVNQAVDLLKDHMRKHKVFLAIDNVWEGAYESVCKIMKVHFTQGSKILVTSRSLRLLKEILAWHDGVTECIVMPIPGITEEEALEALVFYGGHSVCRVSSEELNKVVRSCFFEGQCHPLLLKAMGHKLQSVAGRMDSAGIWKDLEKAVLSVLKTSYNEITPTLQKIFLDLRFFGPDFSGLQCDDLAKIFGISDHECDTLAKKCEWLSMLYKGLTGDDIRDKLIKLEYHGLLELDQHNDDIRIHDLYRDVAEAAIVASGKYLEVGKKSGDSDRCSHTIEWSKLERIWIGNWCSHNALTTILHNLKQCVKAEFLYVTCHEGPVSLSLKGMKSLRVLGISGYGMKTVKNWNMAPNLVSVLILHESSTMKLLQGLGCHSNLEKLGLHACDFTPWQNLILRNCTLTALQNLICPIGNLTSLKILNLTFLSWQTIPGVKGLTNLTELNLKHCSLKELNLEGLTNLTKLSFYECDSLKELNLKGLTNLTELDVVYCESLEELNLKGLTNLTKLHVTMRELHVTCKSLKELNLEGLTSLTELDVTGCKSFKELNLEGLTNLTKLGVVCCDSLKELNLEGLTNLTELNVVYCFSLEELNLKGLTNLTKLRVTGCYSLNELSLEGLKNLTGDCSQT